MTALEKDIEKKLRQLVEAGGGRCLKWVCPGWSGVPDRIILLPFGRICFVETKRPKGGKLSKLQQWWGAELHRLGFGYGVIWSENDLAIFAADVLGRHFGKKIDVSILDEYNKRSKNVTD